MRLYHLDKESLKTAEIKDNLCVIMRIHWITITYSPFKSIYNEIQLFQDDICPRFLFWRSGIYKVNLITLHSTLAFKFKCVIKWRIEKDSLPWYIFVLHVQGLFSYRLFLLNISNTLTLKCFNISICNVMWSGSPCNIHLMKESAGK